MIRIILLLCLILGLAGASLTYKSEKHAVVFVLDISDSISDAGLVRGLEFIRTSLDQLRKDDKAGIIVFGADPLVDIPISDHPQLQSIASIPETNQTNIGSAIQLALSILPTDASRRIILLSDGVETSGLAVRSAQLAGSIGVEILAVPLISDEQSDVIVTDIQAPTNLYEGDTFNLSFSIYSNEETLATIAILAKGQLIYQQQEQLNKGSQTFSIPLNAEQAGLIDFTVQVIPEFDKYLQNNSKSTYSRVAGPPRFLIVAVSPERVINFDSDTATDETSTLLSALAHNNIETEVIPPELLPQELSLLGQYAGVILVNVPAREFAQAQMESLRIYVRDTGGGLIVIGGPNSYGIGGYFRTPLEDMLPVDMQIKDEVRRPSLTMVFVIDRSGSMSESSGGETKLDLAKEAAIRSVELLASYDKVGVVLFDENAQWVVPITEVGDATAIINSIGTIRSGGGTDIYAGVLAVKQELPSDDAQIKHIILLTDGGADPSGIPLMIRDMHENHGITFTTVAIGRDAAPFLVDLATIGGGRYHFVSDPSRIPSVFTEETSLATRSYLIEESFIPQISNPSPLLSGISSTPPLEGYVGTSIKDAAKAILVSHLGDPILATWQYGLGKVIAFTSDASGRWANNWIVWDGFPTFWGQVVNFVAINPGTSDLDISINSESGQSEILLITDALSNQNLYGATFQGSIVQPDGKIQTVTFSQIAAGQYKASFETPNEGFYSIGISGHDGNGIEYQESIGWIQSYSNEYSVKLSDPELLQAVAAVSGGYLLDDPMESFENFQISPRALQPIWPQLLLFAVILLPLDIASRRLIITKQDWIKFGKLITEKLTSKNEPTLSAQREQQLEALISHKTSKRDENIELASPIIFPVDKDGIKSKETSLDSKNKIADSTGSTAETLLKKKRERQKGKED